MTVIAAKVYDDRISFAADTQITTGGTKEHIQDVKLFETKHGVIVGSTGYVEEIQLFRHFLKTHTPDAADEESIADLLIEFAKHRKNLTGDWKNLGNLYLIGYEGRLFECNGFCVLPVEDSAAIGSGSRFALGALSMGASAYDAVEIACSMDIYCSLPITELRLHRD